MANTSAGGRVRPTEKTVPALAPPAADSPGRKAEYPDSEIIGLRLWVLKAGRSFFDVRYRLYNVGPLPNDRFLSVVNPVFVNEADFTHVNKRRAQTYETEP